MHKMALIRGCSTTRRRNRGSRSRSLLRHRKPHPHALAHTERSAVRRRRWSSTLPSSQPHSASRLDGKHTFAGAPPPNRHGAPHQAAGAPSTHPRAARNRSCNAGSTGGGTFCVICASAGGGLFRRQLWQRGKWQRSTAAPTPRQGAGDTPPCARWRLSVAAPATSHLDILCRRSRVVMLCFASVVVVKTT